MIDDISLIYSDSAILDEPRYVIYVQRDLVAKRYGMSPIEVDKLDPFDYNFGFVCHSAEIIAEQRLENRARMKQNMKSW